MSQAGYGPNLTPDLLPRKRTH